MDDDDDDDDDGGDVDDDDEDDDGGGERIVSMRAFFAPFTVDMSMLLLLANLVACRNDDDDGMFG